MPSPESQAPKLTPDNHPASGLHPAIIVLLVLVGSGVLCVPIAAGFLIPSLLKGRSQAYKMQCAMNLRQLGQLAVQGADKTGTFETGVDGIRRIWVEGTPFIGKMLVCPEDATVSGWAPDTASVSAATTSYTFVPWQLELSDASALLLYETEPHPDGRNILMTDQSVRFVSEEEFRDLFAAQKAKYENR